MVFWAIVLGIIAVVLLVSWRYDRRRRRQIPIDMGRRINSAIDVNMFKAQDAEQGAVPSTRGIRMRGINQWLGR